MTSFPFPGIATTADGSEAVDWAETHITQGACAYPITPSTNMGGLWSGVERQTRTAERTGGTALKLITTR
jgi:pyruvate/2-oxoacid:ferredoxin oxidoreductase alpha subunit